MTTYIMNEFSSKAKFQAYKWLQSQGSKISEKQFLSEIATLDFRVCRGIEIDGCFFAKPRLKAILRTKDDGFPIIFFPEDRNGSYIVAATIDVAY